MPQLDSITIEVIRNYLLSAAREMNRNLIRTAYSTVIYEVRDFGVGLYDRECRLLAEAPGLAIFTRGNDYALRQVVDYLGYDNLHPGDIVLLNYPYWSAAHTLDVAAVAPIFYGDTLVGFAAAKQHWQDLGQKDAGYCTDTTSLFQEGLVIPCLKIYKQGVLNQDLVDIIRFNSRMPERVLGDMHAKLSSCRTGERRVRELVEKFGLDTFQAAAEAILSHGERLARARLAQLPQGTWSAEDWVDDDGIDRETLVKIKATVTVTEDEMLVDFSGSSPQTLGPINVPFGMTQGVAALVFKAITTPDSPANEGNFRPLRVIAPPGSLMHATPPAATFTLWPALLAIEVITKALAQAMPEVIPACSGGDIYSVMGTGIHPRTGKMWVEGCNEGVGFGGHAGGDGENSQMHPSEPGCRNNPIEILETKAPWLIEHYRLRQDSAGPGQHRGGLGSSRCYRLLADATALTMMKKSKTRPWGMAGGGAAHNGFSVYWPGTERETVTGTRYQAMAARERFCTNSAGGGGWGDPFRRDPQQVLADVRNEYVSAQRAREAYRVVIDSATMTVDEGATAVLRSQVSNPQQEE